MSFRADVDDEMEHDRRQGWYLDRGINPAYLVLLLSTILSCLYWAGNVNERLGRQDVILTQHEKVDSATEKRVDVLERGVKEDLKAINDKLDRLIERRH